MFSSRMQQSASMERPIANYWKQKVLNFIFDQGITNPKVVVVIEQMNNKLTSLLLFIPSNITLSSFLAILVTNPMPINLAFILSKSLKIGKENYKSIIL